MSEALARRIIDDLRKEAAQAIRASVSGNEDHRRNCLRQYQELRKLANRYEAWLEKMPATWGDAHER